MVDCKIVCQYCIFFFFLASSNIFECMHLTASSKPGRKYAFMKKCALIRKVRLTTRVYGSLLILRPLMEQVVYFFSLHILLKITGDSSHKENFRQYTTTCIPTKEDAMKLKSRNVADKG